MQLPVQSKQMMLLLKIHICSRLNVMNWTVVCVEFCTFYRKQRLIQSIDSVQFRLNKASVVKGLGTLREALHSFLFA